MRVKKRDVERRMHGKNFPLSFFYPLYKFQILINILGKKPHKFTSQTGRYRKFYYIKEKKKKIHYEKKKKLLDFMVGVLLLCLKRDHFECWSKITQEHIELHQLKDKNVIENFFFLRFW